MILSAIECGKLHTPHLILQRWLSALCSEQILKLAVSASNNVRGLPPELSEFPKYLYFFVATNFHFERRAKYDPNVMSNYHNYEKGLYNGLSVHFFVNGFHVSGGSSPSWPSI